MGSLGGDGVSIMGCHLGLRWGGTGLNLQHLGGYGKAHLNLRSAIPSLLCYVGQKMGPIWGELGNIWVCSPPPLQEVQEMLCDFELQHCFVDRHSGTGERH